MTFDDAFEYVLIHEGYDKLTFDKRDLGGLTKWGISQRAHPDVEIDQLTKAQAKRIYKYDYWKPCACDGLPQQLRLIVFDCAVNQGVSFAVRALQRAIGASEDGIVGPNTLRKVRAQDPYVTLEKFSQLRMQRYLKTKTFDRFGRGWLNRLIAVTIKSKTTV